MGEMKKRLTAGEREALMALNVAAQVTDRCKALLGNRLSLVKGGGSHLGLAKYWIDRVFGDVVETIPEDQMASYRRNVRGCSYTVGVRSPHNVHDRDYGVWVSLEMLRELHRACQDRCLMCEKDRSERRACALRRALSETVMDERADGKADGDCPWWGGI